MARQRRRATTAAVSALAALAACGLGGCASSSASSGQGFARDLVVRFDLPAGQFTPPAAEVAAVRANCPGGPHARPEALPPADAAPSVRLNGVRYNVAGADDGTISQLQACIQRRRGVVSADLEDEDS